MWYNVDRKKKYMKKNEKKNVNAFFWLMKKYWISSKLPIVNKFKFILFPNENKNWTIFLSHVYQKQNQWIVSVKKMQKIFHNLNTV